MMRLEEGNELLGQYTPHEDSIDKCINNPKAGKDWEVSLCLAMGNAADAVEIMCVGFIMAEMDDASSLDKELLSSAVFIGMLCGGLLGGYLSDVIGRRTSLLWALSLNAVAGLTSAAATSTSVLIAIRVVAGVGIGASVPIVFSLGAEVFPSPRRGFFLSIIASFWMVGAIFTAFSAWIILGKDMYGARIIPQGTWRIFAVIAALPTICALSLTYWKVPESPRFLINRGKYEEAADLLSTMSTVTVTAHELITDCAQPCKASHPSSSSTSSSPASSSHSPHPQGLSLHDSISVLLGDRLRLTTLVLCCIWFTLSFGSYGISTWIAVLFEDVGIGNAYAASFIFALANLPGNLVSLLLIDKYGRRALLGWGMGLAGLSALGFALDTRDAAVVVLFASMFNAFSTQGWNSLDCLSAELFPTATRSTAMGVLAACGRLGAIAGQFVNGSLEHSIPLLLFVTTSCSLFGGLVSFALPHDSTGSLALTETLADGEQSTATPTEAMEGEYSPIHTVISEEDGHE